MIMDARKKPNKYGKLIKLEKEAVLYSDGDVMETCMYQQFQEVNVTPLLIFAADN